MSRADATMKLCLYVTYAGIIAGTWSTIVVWTAYGAWTNNDVVFPAGVFWLSVAPLLLAVASIVTAAASGWWQAQRSRPVF